MDNESLKSKNRQLIIKLTIGTVLMFGFGFALVPLYDVMCKALGINGKTNEVAAVQPTTMVVDESRTIRVQFMAHVSNGMPWKFEPKVSHMDVHPGQVIQTAFLANNLSSDELVGQAVPSVSPGQGASYFNKIECFCFHQQPLSAKADAEMPLIFYIEPDIPYSIHTLTLSYTLYNITEKAEPQLVKTSQSAHVNGAPTQGANL
ncbi:cytochrome c oxidase assembly protein subunit 11 [Vibrio diazotrophicus]|uniref:Cytochrome c oxidase assembly protein CtaG n=1 Tax=Vibrio diazotrophicus TaxID=685 RepID=A0A329EB78_VIBDI|nr:cytochrome c oxidase assembly protein [Vibrio diazotrophicus]RAS66380.1 cytochrome c oxidase assembly protein subunit 11 [Vibrio diazotrophicus]